MRQRSITVTIRYPDGQDDRAMVILDKMKDWLIDIPDISFQGEFGEPQDANPDMWEDFD